MCGVVCRKKERVFFSLLPRTDEWGLRFWSGIFGREPPTLWNNSAGRKTTKANAKESVFKIVVFSSRCL